MSVCGRGQAIAQPGPALTPLARQFQISQLRCASAATPESAEFSLFVGNEGLLLACWGRTKVGYVHTYLDSTHFCFFEQISWRGARGVLAFRKRSILHH